MSSRLDDINRRQFLQRVGATTVGAGAVYYGGTQYAGSPAQNGQAIAPLVAAGALGGAAAIGWALREFEVLGSDDIPEGLTAGALKNAFYETARARHSNDKSTFVDNRNILKTLEHPTYAEGKVAAIDALNREETQADVQQAALDAADEFTSTILHNIAKSWNESVREWNNILTKVREHPDVTAGDVLARNQDWARTSACSSGPVTYELGNKTTHTLPNGTTIEVEQMKSMVSYSGSSCSWGNEHVLWTPFGQQKTDARPPKFAPISHPNPDNDDIFDLNNFGDWRGLTLDIENKLTEVSDGLITWVDAIYNDIQAGTLDTADLLTPAEQAQLTTEDSGFAQAQSDLMALNISVDLDREAEVYLPDIDATIYGSIGYTGDTQLEVGTVDPNALDADGNEVYPGSFYFTYDISRGEGTWGQYNEGIDGGTLTFTAEPYEETTYRVHTSHDETVELTATDFTDNDDGTWTVDLSDQLETSITNADSIKFYSQTGDTQYETIQLKEIFEIRAFTDSEGNQYQSSSFERNEPQTDNNYITQEEWDEQRIRHEKLIEAYETAQAGGGGAVGLGNLIDGLAIGPVPGKAVAAGGTAGLAWLWSTLLA